MDEQQHLEDDTNKASSNVQSPVATETSSSVTAPYSPIKDEPATVYICSPNQSKQKQLESVLHGLNPSCSVVYYSTTTSDDDEKKLACSEENDVMAIGSIRFPTTLQAEKAYALLNGTSLPASTSSLSPTTIQFRYNSFVRHYHGDTTNLLIDHLPDTMSISAIYDLLRQYGPIAKCQCICPSNDDDGNDIDNPATSAIKKLVEVEFLQNEDANDAQAQLSQKTFNDQHLSITVITGIPYRSKPFAQRDRAGNSIPAEIGTSPPNKGKRKDKKRLSQPLIQKDEKPLQQRQQHALQVEIKPSMDLCNLYIKGLSLSMTSNELFNLFKPHGRIISARVMANDQGVSKGFGFVSFSQPIEAASAMVHLHQHYSILFHEPKVPRSDHDIQQQYWSLVQSPLSAYFYSTTVSLPSPSTTTMDTLPPPPQQQPPSTAIPYYLYTAPPFAYPPAPTAPYYYHPPPPVYYAPYPYQPPSIPTMSTQRSEMQQAVQQALTNDKQQQEIVDMLMDLDESEKQKCLNDMAYLKEKMNQLHG